MAGTAVDNATGILVVFNTTSFAPQIVNVAWGGIERAVIDVSHMAVAAAGSGKFGNMLFIPGDLSNPGQLTLDIHHNPDTEPPIDQPAETIDVTYPVFAGDSTGAKWSASGFLVSYEMTGELESKMTAVVVVQFSGNVTQTAAA